MYHFHSHPGGAWNLVDTAQELTDRHAEFVKFYNANDGIPAIKHFKSNNCCWTLRSGKRLYVNNAYSYPAVKGSNKCNPSDGYAVSNSYHFHNARTISASTKFSEGSNCADAGNPALYYRGEVKR